SSIIPPCSSAWCAMPPRPLAARRRRSDASASFRPDRPPFLTGDFAMQSNVTSQNEKLHVGIIMDGNGRWATRRGLSRVRGHEAGVEAIRRIVEAAPKQGIGTLTLYAFSSDNWRRPRAEVTAVMGLLKFELANDVDALVR